MARPTLTQDAQGNWYRNGKRIHAGYKYYELTTGEWMQLGNDGKFHVYNVGVRTSGKAPTGKELAVQRARHDLAPKVPFVPIEGGRFLGPEYKQGLKNHLMQNYYQVKDSIGKRVTSGFYDQYPEQYQRDLEYANQYKDNADKEPKATCINSVAGLYGQTQWSNQDFANNTYKKKGYSRTPVATVNNRYTKDVDLEKNSATLEQLGPGTILQIPGLGHAVMYLGNNQWYNNHGSSDPYKNGSQIENESYYDFMDRAGYQFLNPNLNAGYFYVPTNTKSYFPEHTRYYYFKEGEK